MQPPSAPAPSRQRWRWSVWLLIAILVTIGGALTTIVAGTLRERAAAVRLAAEETAAHATLDEGLAAYRAAMAAAPGEHRDAAFHHATVLCTQAITAYRRLCAERPNDAALEAQLIEACKLKFGSEKYASALAPGSPRQEHAVASAAADEAMAQAAIDDALPIDRAAMAMPETPERRATFQHAAALFSQAAVQYAAMCAAQQVEVDAEPTRVRAKPADF